MARFNLGEYCMAQTEFFNEEMERSRKKGASFRFTTSGRLICFPVNDPENIEERRYLAKMRMRKLRQQALR